jgi:hypothetical protein
MSIEARPGDEPARENMSIEARPEDKPAYDKMSIEAPGPLWKRLAWFVGLWIAGVVTVTLVAYSIRYWIA